MATMVPYIPLITSVASGFSALEQGRQQSAALEYNAQVARQQARAEIERARLEESQFRRRARQVQGAQRAAMGASGAVVGSGSFGDIIADDAIQAELGALAIRYGGQQQARFYSQQAQLDRRRAASSRQTGILRAGTSLLTGAYEFRSEEE